MDVTVLVTTCADSEGLRRCLAATAPQVEAAGGELLLVVNAEPEVLPEHSRSELEKRVHRIVFEPRVGKSHALNRGVAEAQGRIVAFTDDDAIPRPGWLEALVEPLRAPEDPRLVGTGGRVIPNYPRRVPRWYALLIRGHQTHFLGPHHDLGPEAVDYPASWTRGTGPAPLGANCAYRREVFDERRYAEDLGPNRETGLRGGEDYELGHQLLRDGFRLRFCPGAEVEHPVDPGRLDREYVRRAYFASGVEDIRLRRRLGMPLPGLEKMRRKVRRRLPNVVTKPWMLLPSRIIERSLRHERHRGRLHELEAHERSRAGS